MDRPTLAGILRTHGSTYRRSHALSPTQARAWRAIVDCRTAALGGVRERCANCGAERHVWRSSRNRHCPQCQTRAKEDWRAARLRDVLTVPCAHWVLPHALNPLAMRHPRWLYGALFDSAAATLLELAANPRWLGAVRCSRMTGWSTPSRRQAGPHRCSTTLARHVLDHSVVIEAA